MSNGLTVAHSFSLAFVFAPGAAKLSLDMQQSLADPVLSRIANAMMSRS
jgi:hypothetical protein